MRRLGCTKTSKANLAVAFKMTKLTALRTRLCICTAFSVNYIFAIDSVVTALFRADKLGTSREMLLACAV